MEVVLYLVLALAVFFILKKTRKNYWKKRNVPGPQPIPLLGNMLEFFKKPNTEIYLDGIKKYGKVYGYMEFTRPALVVGDPELLKDILIKDFHVFSDRTSAISDSVFTQVLPFLKGETWKRIRKSSGPAFSAAKLRNFVLHMREAADIFKTILNSTLEKDVNLHEVTAALTLDTIARTAFGIDSNCQVDPQDKFYKHALEIMNFKFHRILFNHVTPAWFKKLLGIDLLPHETMQYMRDLMTELYRRETQLKGEAKSLLGLWLRGREGSAETPQLTLEELIAQGTVFIGAGFETTATLLMMCFYTMAVRPDIQERLFHEITQHWSEECINSGDFSNLTYLDAFINEVLRRYSPVVCWDRDADVDYVLGNTGITIEKGTKVVTPFYAIHNDKDFYSEPDLVKPERFLPENKDSLPKYAFLPFGLGPRNCVGLKFGLMEAKVILTEVVREFLVVPCSKTSSQIRSKGFFITLMLDPLYVKFRKRDH